MTLTVKGKQSFVLVSTAAIACGGLRWQGFTDELVHSFIFGEFGQVLRSLLPLALVCFAWTLPAMARLPRCPHECDRSLKGNSGRCYKITPQREALLRTIRRAEGTLKQEEDGYRVLFGGTMVDRDDLDRHPNKVISKGRYTSAAAGAYQFLPPTWEIAKKALKLKDFGPDSQDQAALFLIQRRCALPLADEGKLTPQLVAKLAPEWASFPKVNGKSYYGQPVRRFRDLEGFYYPELANLVRQRLEWQLAAGPPPPIPEEELVASSPPTPTRWIPVATSASCDGELICLLDHVAAGGAPIQPGSIISQS